MVPLTRTMNGNYSFHHVNGDQSTGFHTGAMEASGYKVFNDSVHGHITLHPLLVKVVDTPEFQRLRNIKQLGVANFVFPGGGHSRFEHSLGTCYLAGRMVKKLLQRDSARGRTEEEEKKLTLCVQLAALCHDLGHGPFSHTWEGVVKHCTEGKEAWSHEKASVEMIDHLVEKYNLKEKFENEGFGENWVEIVKELVLGGPKGEKKPLLTGCNKFLYEIVSSDKTVGGIDVDKWDYFLRDGLHLNLRITFDYHRLLEFCTVMPTGSDRNVETHIAFRDKEMMNLYDMYRVRSALHHTAYRHKVVTNIELMLIDGFKAAWDAHYRINNSETFLKDAHKTSTTMSEFTDHVFYDILFSKDESLKDARSLFERILKRKLYKFVGKAHIECRRDIAEINLAEEKRKLDEYLKTNFKNLKFRIGEFYLPLDSENDPVSKVRFYKKVRGTNDIVAQKYEEMKEELSPFPFKLAEKATAQLLVFCSEEDVKDDELKGVQEIIAKWPDIEIRTGSPKRPNGTSNSTSRKAFKK